MSKAVTIYALGFVVLSLVHFFSQRPLWLDEDYVYQNIVNLKYAELFGPLRPVQSFPRVYLAVIKWLGSFFDQHVLALRLLPLICMTGALFVWRKLYAGSSKAEGQSQFPLLMFTWLCSYWMVYYAAELKPYSMDVLAVGLYTLFFAYQSRFDHRSATSGLWAGAILLPCLLFFSYAAIFVFWIAVYNFLRLAQVNRGMRLITVVSGAISLGCFAVFYFTDIRHSITTEGVNYWQSYFLCTDSVGCFFETLGEGIKRYSVYWWGAQKAFRRAGVIFIPLFLYGLYRYGWTHLRKDQFRIMTVDALSVILMLEFVVLGLAQKYPFTGERITLFFAPFVFYILIKALYSARRLKYLGNVLFFYYIGYCCVSLAVSAWTYVRLYS